MNQNVSSSADDEGEPVNLTRYLPHFFLLLFFSSCSYSKVNNELVSIVLPVTESKLPAAKPAPPPKKKKKLYITFDDGPNKGTRNVLQVLNEEQVPVSFFVVGEHVYGSREQQVTWDSLQHNAWVEICNHSYTHAHNKFSKFYSNDTAVVADFERTQDSLQLNNRIVRTPGRNMWRTTTINASDIAKSKAAADSLYSNGFVVMGWDLEWHYNDSMKLKQSSAELIQQVDSMLVYNKTKTPDHIVLLTHDQTFVDSISTASLRNFIKQMKTKQEYEIEFISRYPGLK
ncbi:xylanase [Lacibacter luteus]|uniref:Xylanase n=1 Tax=Lacibacter luteus TaxID=2508719 RepID=A0A4Q1CHG7_9BACT|nr:polysaccharide deacetylase family protein [Lacibacter luteus]RXK59773.1 xylanase [Lacibacter luteus]